MWQSIAFCSRAILTGKLEFCQYCKNDISVLNAKVCKTFGVLSFQKRVYSEILYILSCMISSIWSKAYIYCYYYCTTEHAELFSLDLKDMRLCLKNSFIWTYLMILRYHFSIWSNQCQIFYYKIHGYILCQPGMSLFAQRQYSSNYHTGSLKTMSF